MISLNELSITPSTQCMKELSNTQRQNGYDGKKIKIAKETTEGNMLSNKSKCTKCM